VPVGVAVGEPVGVAVGVVVKSVNDRVQAPAGGEVASCARGTLDGTLGATGCCRS
jgi:hypothetical protein